METDSTVGSYLLGILFTSKFKRYEPLNFKAEIGNLPLKKQGK